MHVLLVYARFSLKASISSAKKKKNHAKLNSKSYEFHFVVKNTANFHFKVASLCISGLLLALLQLLDCFLEIHFLDKAYS